MSLATAIVALKAANAPLVALLGPRFYQNAVPQEVTMPCAKFQEISRPNSGAMGPVVVNYHPRVQIDGYVQSVRSGGTVDPSALRTLLFNAFYGKAGSYGGQTIKAVLLETEMSDIESFDNNNEADHVRMEFLVDFE